MKAAFFSLIIFSGLKVSAQEQICLTEVGVSNHASSCNFLERLVARSEAQVRLKTSCGMRHLNLDSLTVKNVMVRYDGADNQCLVYVNGCCI